MIICPVCNTKNIHLDIICKNCSCFLQQKIENINLFEVLWLLVENPKRALKLVALAKHKNFVLIFSILIGISSTFQLFEIIKIYDLINKPLLILAAGFVVGFPLGFLILTTFTYLTIFLTKIFNLVRLKFKQIYSTLAFAATPIIYIFVFIFPTKIIAFGANAFSNNPSPSIINPAVYWITEGLTFLFIFYFFVLLIISFMVLFELKLIKALILTFILSLFVTICCIAIFKFLIYNLLYGSSGI